ncbi:MAG: hypothetical protein K2Z25_16380 [Beijerinckiaceae bacterium]|nr:hypothetical protein [Beijerinckiaceae bacterium]
MVASASILSGEDRGPKSAELPVTEQVDRLRAFANRYEPGALARFDVGDLVTPSKNSGLSLRFDRRA